MQFATPNAFFWLLLAVPLIALYFLRIKPRVQSVSTIAFWHRVIPDTLPRKWWQRLRHPLALAVTLLLLALLTCALANPVGLAWRAPPRIWVVVVDNSASMQTTDVGRSRFEWAQSQAMRHVRTLRPQDQMCLITAGTSVRVQCGMTANPNALRKAVSSLRPTDGPQRLGRAIQLARRLSPAAASVRVMVLTDGQGQQSLGDTDESITVVACGTATDNWAITEFQVRRHLNDPVSFEVLIEAANFTQDERSTTVELRLNDQLLDVIPISIQPGARWRDTLPYTGPTGGILVATLAAGDRLACDDQAAAILAEVQRQKLVLATPGSLYLESVLRALPEVDLEVVDRVPPDTPPDSILVVHRLPGTQLPAGNQLLIDVTEDVPWQVGDELAVALISSQSQSPLLTHVQLRELPAPGAHLLEFDRPVGVLAATDEACPVYFSCENPLGGDRLVLNLSLERGDFPLRIAFPLLVKNAVHWLGGRWSSFYRSYPTGTTAVLAQDPLPPESAPPQNARQLVAPGGIARGIVAANAPTIGPFDEAGVWELRTVPVADASGDSEPSSIRRFASNVASGHESDLRFQGTAATPPSSLGGTPAWVFLVMLATAISAVEWALFHRRWLG